MNKRQTRRSIREGTLSTLLRVLYPSNIREYNVCFSVIKRPLAPLTNYYKPKKTEKKHKEEDQMKEEKIE